MGLPGALRGVPYIRGARVQPSPVRTMQDRPCVSVTTMVQDPSGAMNNSTIRRASVNAPTACRVSPNRCSNRSTSLFCGPHSTCPAAGVGHRDRADNKKAARTAAIKPKGAVNIPFTCVLGSVKPRLRRSPPDQSLRSHSSLGYQPPAPETVLPDVKASTYSVDGLRSALQLNPRAQLSHKRWAI